MKHTAAAVAELFDLAAGPHPLGLLRVAEHQVSKLSGAGGAEWLCVAFVGCRPMEVRWGEKRPREAS